VFTDVFITKFDYSNGKPVSPNCSSSVPYKNCSSCSSAGLCFQCILKYPPQKEDEMLTSHYALLHAHTKQLFMPHWEYQQLQTFQLHSSV